jgi:hypothetical protein
MPWLETSPVEQRERFIRDHQAGLYMMTELCARYAVRASPTLRKTPLGLSILLGLTISILNRVARRTKQCSQANAAAGPSAEALKDPIRSELSPPGGRRTGLAAQTEDIQRTLRGLLSS